MRCRAFPRHAGESFRFDGASDEAMSVFVRLMQYHKLQSRAMYNMVASRELFHAQMVYLKVIANDEGLSQSDLADRVGVERASVSTALQRMEKAEYIVRRPDENDRRKTHIYLSEKGRQLNRETDEELTGYINGCFKLSGAELKAFTATLDKINGAVTEFIENSREE